MIIVRRRAKRYNVPENQPAGRAFAEPGFSAREAWQKEAILANLTIYRVEEVWSPFSFAKRIVDC